MYIGPIRPLAAAGIGTGHSPVKPIKVAQTDGKSPVLFDTTYPYPLQSDVPMTQFDTVIYSNTQAAALVLVHQIEEMTQNAEWQRCGLFIQWREDGVPDGEDGWYVIKDAEISEDIIFSGYAEPKITVELRARQAQTLGSFVDSKAVPNDYNLSGVGLAAWPQGLGTQIFPTATWTYTAKDGTQISVVENPPQVLKGNLQTPVQTMTTGRCSVFDSTVNDSTATEVFWKDHRNINGYYKFDNGLLRYTVNLAGGDPLIEWPSGGNWTTVGNFQLNNGNVSIQSVSLWTISPEEIVWIEDRIGSGAYFRVQCRIRRGSRIIEVAVVAAGNQAFNIPGQIQLTNTPNNIAYQLTADNTAAVGQSQSTMVPGFLYLSKPPNPPTTGNGNNVLTSNQADLEAGVTTGWQASANCTITNTTAQARTGTHSLQLSSTAAGDMSAQTNSIGQPATSVAAGQSYTASAYFRSAVSARTVKVFIDWYDANGTNISSVGSAGVADTTTGWTQQSVTATAPTGALFADIKAYVVATGAASEVHYVDSIMLTQGSSTTWAAGSATPIFDSGYTIPAGTIIRFGIMVGTQDAQWNAYARPTAPTPVSVVTAGTAGSTQYTYAIYGVSAQGTYSLRAVFTQLTTGNATLTNTNYNTLTWNAGANDVSYVILCTQTNGTRATGVIARGITSTTYNDQVMTALSTNIFEDNTQWQTYATNLSGYNRQRIRQRILVTG